MVKISMATKREIIEKHKGRYLKANKKDKGQILDEVCNITGLSRNRTLRLLNGSIKMTNRKVKDGRGRKPIYTEEVKAALRIIWTLMDFACGKRLAAGMNNFIDALKRHNEFDFNEDIEHRLRIISPATIDRILRPHKDAIYFKGKSTTKPGTLLKHQIPVRLGNQWDEDKPGFVEIDLVAHCGPTTAGEYVNTLDVTDICTGWTETRAVINKARAHVFDALMFIEGQAPFNYLGIDSDNGKEFINNHLYSYCKENDIAFTRTRAYRKNDNCHVEQKNWAVVRRHIGYDRYEGQLAVDLMNDYYENLRLYLNFFLPQTKIIDKTYDGAKVKKHYEKYLTPYQRVLNSDDIDKVTKEELTKVYLTLNPVKLKTDMMEILEELRKLATPWQR